MAKKRKRQIGPDEVFRTDTEDFEKLTWREQDRDLKFKHGKYSTEEIEMLQAALLTEAAERGFNLDAYEWLEEMPKAKNEEDFWVAVLRRSKLRRRVRQIYMKARNMWHPCVRKKGVRWTADEDMALMAFVAQHADKKRGDTPWKDLGTLLGRHWDSCRDRWRHIRKEFERGSWTAEEDEMLRTIVGRYLLSQGRDLAPLHGCIDEEKVRAAFEEGEKAEQAKQYDPARYLALWRQDNINWDWVASQMPSRNYHQCMNRFYFKLRASMVASGEWGPHDDRIMFEKLLKQRAKLDFEHQVDWDNIVPGRTAEVAIMRWHNYKRSLWDPSAFRFGTLIASVVRREMPELWQEVRERERAARSNVEADDDKHMDAVHNDIDERYNDVATCSAALHDNSMRNKQHGRHVDALQRDRSDAGAVNSSVGRNIEAGTSGLKDGRVVVADKPQMDVHRQSAASQEPQKSRKRKGNGSHAAKRRQRGELSAADAVLNATNQKPANAFDKQQQARIAGLLKHAAAATTFAAVKGNDSLQPTTSAAPQSFKDRARTAATALHVGATANAAADKHAAKHTHDRDAAPAAVKSAKRKRATEAVSVDDVKQSSRKAAATARPSSFKQPRNAIGVH